MMERKGLEDVVKVQGNYVSLTESPENLRVFSIARPAARLSEDPLVVRQLASLQLVSALRTSLIKDPVIR